jgi:hypothetical protein
MSTEHVAKVVIGFSVGEEDLTMPFKTTVPEKSHVEERYHQHTGEKLEPVTVVDSEEHEAYVLDGEEHADLQDFLEALGGAVGCVIGTHGDFFCGDLEYSIQPKQTANKSAFNFAEVRDLEAECRRIAKAFNMYGIHLGAPTVFALHSVY